MADKRLIQAAFPLKRVSLDSVHEKNVRHGHISTLHIWLATPPPDPGSRDECRKLLTRVAGPVMETPSASGERMKEEARGVIFHWGREDGGNGLRLATSGLGTAGNGRGEAGVGGALSDVCGVRAGAAQGARAVRFVHSAADGALPAPAAEAARNGRGRPSVGDFAQRGIRSLPSGERGESALGGEAGE